MKILVVDESLTMRRIIIKYLALAGFTEVVEAPEAPRAGSRS